MIYETARQRPVVPAFRNNTAQILAIMPSQSIQNMISEAASARDDCTLNAYTGNLYSGVEIAKQFYKNYDVIIARGETADMIKKAVPIPVIDIQLSFYDVLHATKLAEQLHEPYAVVGFSPVTRCAHMLRDLLQMDLDIYNLCSLEDAASTIEVLRNKGYRLIVSGMGFDHIIRRCGLNSILITTGKDSILEALDRAVYFCKSIFSLKQERDFLQTILEERGEDMMVFDHHNNLICSQFHEMEQDIAFTMAVRELQNSDADRSQIQKNHKNTLISMKKKPFSFDGNDYHLFHFTQQNIPYHSKKNEIRTFSRDEVLDVFLRHFHETSACSYGPVPTLRELSNLDSPILLFGEPGLGKEQLAAALYVRGKQRNHPYTIIDFSQFTDRSWNYLISNSSSPLYETSGSLYFRNLNRLSFDRISQLSCALYDMRLCKRSQVYFSYTVSPGQALPEPVESLINQLSCVPVHLIPLRDRAEEIPALAGLYISTANIEYARQVTGFTPEALQLLKSYSWPYNLLQFSRVVLNLVSCAVSSYIQAEQVRGILENEDRNRASVPLLSNILSLNRTMREIERDVAKAVLEELDGNQSQAAKRLGIGRSTLWRLVNRTD